MTRTLVERGRAGRISCEVLGASRPPWRRRSREARLRRQLHEAYQALGIVAAFVAFSALLAVAQGDATSRNRVRGHGAVIGSSSPSVSLRSTPHVVSENPTVWLIDGFNVLNVAILQREERVDFWGPAARGRLLDLIAARPDAAAVIIVFDGSRPAPLDPAEADCLGAARAEVVFADDADEWLLRRVREDREPGRIAVVTADRRLAARAHRRGAQIVAPSRFVAECRHTGEAGGETLTEHAPAPRGDRVCAVAKKLKPRA